MYLLHFRLSAFEADSAWARLHNNASQLANYKQSTSNKSFHENHDSKKLNEDFPYNKIYFHMCDLLRW
jgi:hypothetical protein